MLHFGVKENCFTYNQTFIVISFFHIETFHPSGSHINSQETNNTYKKKKKKQTTHMFQEVLETYKIHKCLPWGFIISEYFCG